MNTNLSRILDNVRVNVSNKYANIILPIISINFSYFIYMSIYHQQYKKNVIWGFSEFIKVIIIISINELFSIPLLKFKNSEKQHALNHCLIHWSTFILSFSQYFIIRKFFSVEKEFHLYRLFHSGALFILLVFHSIDFCLHHSKSDSINYSRKNIFKNTHHIERVTLLLLNIADIMSIWYIKQTKLHLSCFLLLTRFSWLNYIGNADRTFPDDYDKQWYYSTGSTLEAVINPSNMFIVEMLNVLSYEILNNKNQYGFIGVCICLIVHGLLQRPFEIIKR